MVQKEQLIYFVDDEKIILNLLEYAFSNRRYKMQSFSTVEECMENLAKNPDILVIDHSFALAGRSNLTGLDLLREVKRIIPQAGVIVLSSQYDPDLMHQYLMEGAERYISKSSYFVDELAEAIENFLSERRKER